MRASRGLLALTITALAIGTLSMPAAAAGRTRWVDDDGKAGPAGCNGGAAAKTTIQGAVSAADAGDTILVCPGDYPENVVVGPAKDGLTIRAARQWEARIHGDPDATYGNGSSLLLIKNGARDVTVQGLVFVWEGGFGSPTAGFGDCTLETAISVRGQSATILANRVRGTGETFSPCGYKTAIGVGVPLDLLGGTSTPASALVSHNAVRDYVLFGITAIGSGVTATIQRNSVRYWHLSTIQDPPRAAFKARTSRSAWRTVSPSGPGFDTMGIALGLGATGEISGNEISGSPASIVSPVGSRTPPLVYGITSASATGLFVKDNTVRRTLVGYGFYDVDDSRIRGNVSIDHETGIQLGAGGPDAVSNGNRIVDNQVGPGNVGIIIDGTLVAGDVPQNSDNRVTNNTVFGHEEDDCVDGTLGAGTAGTANTWTGNSGITSSPFGLCGTLQ